MNLKSYLRGLGLGIIITALILGISNGSKKEMSDSEIKARARELGMTDTSEVLTENKDNAESSSAPSSSTSSPKKELQTTGTGSTGVTASTETKTSVETKTSAETKTSVDTKTSAETKTTTSGKTSSTETKTISDKKTSSREAKTSAVQKISIVSGDSSYSVASKLEKAGLVKSASEYDSYLCSNGYDKKIRTGTYDIQAGDTDDQIALKITSGQ